MPFSIDDDEMFFEVGLVNPKTGERRTAAVQLSGLEVMHIQGNRRLHDGEGIGPCARTHAAMRAEPLHPGFESTGEIRRVSVQ